MQLVGKVAVITGSGSGIGQAMAQRFAREGAKVVVGDILADEAHAVTASIVQAGGQAKCVVGDSAEPAGADALIEMALTSYGRLDILCNNAGVLDGMVPVAECTDEMWDRVLRINLKGPFLMTRRALRVMLELRSGVILNTASVASLGGGRGGAAYTASKHGIVGLTRATSFYYAEQGIRCNAIAPGAINTAIAQRGETHEEGLMRMMPLTKLIPRFGEPDDVASIAAFLVSDEARYINGTVVTADGGWTVF